MTNEEFKSWFILHIDQMAAMNIYHWNADRAKDIKVVLEILYPELKALEDRLKVVEKTLAL